MNKDTLPQPEDQAYEDRKTESRWAPSTTTMLGSIDVTELDEITELPTGRSSAFEVDFNGSVHCPPPKSLDGTSGFGNETRPGHPISRAADLSPQLRRSIPHSSLGGIRSQNNGCDSSSSASANFQHSAPLSQTETALNASTSMMAQPHNLEEWDGEGDFPLWLGLPDLDGVQITDHGLFNLNDVLEQEGPLEGTTSGAAAQWETKNSSTMSSSFQYQTLRSHRQEHQQLSSSQI